jgi:plastocyanin
MRKPIVAVLAAAALAGFPAAPAVASGGGGCGSPTTEGTGSDVSITGFCFEPTVLYTEPGTTVTFSNMDPVRHNVLGAQGQWGSWETVREGASVTNAFAEPGVYPYVCTWHAGMAGAVVVGAPVEAADTEPVARVTDPAGSPWKAATGVAVGLLLLTLAAVGVRRRSAP